MFKKILQIIILISLIPCYVANASGPGTGSGDAAGGLLASGLYVYNTSTWDRLRSAYGDTLPTTGILAVGLMGWNSSSFDRLQVDGNKALRVNISALDRSNDNVAVLPSPNVVTANITSATSTLVNGSNGNGLLLSVTVGVGVSAATFALYNDATGACDTNLLGTFDASVSGVQYMINAPLSTGICILTNSTANLFVRYMDIP